MDELENIVTKMIEAGESEENIKLVIENYSSLQSPVDQVQNQELVTGLDQISQDQYMSDTNRYAQSLPVDQLSREMEVGAIPMEPLKETVKQSIPDEEFTFSGDIQNALNNIWQNTKGLPDRYELLVSGLTDTFTRLLTGEGNPVSQLNVGEALINLDKVAGSLKPTQRMDEALVSGKPERIGAAVVSTVMELADSMAKTVASGGSYPFAEAISSNYESSLREQASVLGTNPWAVFNEDKDPEFIPIVSGAISGALERIGLGKIGKAILSKAPMGFWKKVTEVAYTSGIEGTTEMLQEVIEQVQSQISTGQDIDVAWSNVTEAGLKGFIGSGVTTGVSTGIKSIIPSVDKVNINKNQEEAIVNEVADTGDPVINNQIDNMVDQSLETEIETPNIPVDEIKKETIVKPKETESKELQQPISEETPEVKKLSEKKQKPETKRKLDFIKEDEYETKSSKGKLQDLVDYARGKRGKEFSTAREVIKTLNKAHNLIKKGQLNAAEDILKETSTEGADYNTKIHLSDLKNSLYKDIESYKSTGNLKERTKEVKEISEKIKEHLSSIKDTFSLYSQQPSKENQRIIQDKIYDYSQYRSEKGLRPLTIEERNNLETTGILSENVQESTGKSKTDRGSQKDRRSRREIEEAVETSKEDLTLAKSMLSSYVKGNIPAYAGYTNKDIGNIIDTIEGSKNIEEFQTSVNNVRNIIEDIEGRKLRSSIQSRMKKIKLSNPNVIPVNFKPLYRSLKKINTNILTNTELAELNGILSDYKSNTSQLSDFLNKYKRIENQLSNEALAEDSKKQSPKVVSEYKKDKKRQKSAAGFYLEKKETLKQISGILEGKTELEKENINAFLNIDLHNKSATDINNAASAMRHLREIGELTNFAGKLIVADQAGKRLTQAFRSGRLGFKFKQLNQSFSNLRNSSQIITHMSRFRTDISKELNELFYAKIREADTKAHSRHYTIMKGITQKANSLGLNNKSLTKVQLFSNIFTTSKNRQDIEAYSKEVSNNVKKYEEALKNKLKAISENKYSGQTVQEVSNEIKIFQDIKESLKNNGREGVLTKKESEFRDYVIDQLQGLRDEFKQSSIVYADKEWFDMNEYIPTQSVGRLDGEWVDLNQKAIDQLSEFNQDKIDDYESGFSNRRQGDVGTAFYDNNMLSVLNRYLHQSLYDTYALKEIKILNKILNDKVLYQTIGSNNIRVLKESLKSSVRIGRGRFTIYPKFLRIAEKLKNAAVIGRMGTVTQFATQLLTTIPAMAVNNPSGFLTANKIALQDVTGTFRVKVGNKEYTSLRDWMNDYGQGIQNRDVMFEKFETEADFKKHTKFISKAAKVSEDTSTYVLKKSDMLAARISFISSYLEQGGDLSKPDRNKIAEAERRTDLMQNISNPRFAPKVFNPESTSGRAIASFLFTFKSFAVQQSLNSIEAMQNLGSKEARRLLAANAINIAMYHTMIIYMGRIMNSGLSPLLEALNISDSEQEEKEERSEKNLVEKISTRSIFDMFTAWLPNFAEDLSKATYDKARKTIIKDINEGEFKRDDTIFFNKYGGPESHLGGYSLFGELIMKSYGQALDIAKDDKEFSDMAELIPESMSMVPILPFRGDISKILRHVSSYKSEDPVKYTISRPESGKRETSKRQLR